MKERVSFRALLLGVVLSAVFAVFSIRAGNTLTGLGFQLAGTQIPIWPFLVLILLAVLINPFFRLIRVVRVFSRVEILTVFIMGMVAAGIPNFGLVEQLLPVVGGLYNRQWNTEQSEWNRHVAPFINEAYFVAEPGIQEAAQRHLAALRAYERIRAEQGPGPEMETAQSAVAEARAALEELEEAAFDKVALFRRGLPRGRRAYPGILPQPGDDTTAYFGRFQRLTLGLAALRQVRGGERMAAHYSAAERLPFEAASAIAGQVEAAVNDMAPLGDAGRYRERVEQYTREIELLHDRRAEWTNRILSLNEERRLADRAGQREFDRKIGRHERELAGIERMEARALQARQRLYEQARIAGEIADITDELAALAVAWRTDPPPAGEARARLREIPAAFSTVDISLRRYLAGEVPWQHWARPLARWALLIAMSYMMMMSLNILIFRQWVHNEKLTYPIAEIPKALLGAPGETGRVPEIFRNGLFWVGVSISAAFMGYNLVCAVELVPGLTPIPLTHSFAPYVQHSAFAILRTERIVIFFTLIGLAFLIPKNISFSLWFFYLCFMGVLLVKDWSGVRADGYSTNWWYLLNFRTATGQGAMIVFSSVVFFKCRRYVFCAFLPSLVRDLDAGERRELRISSALFLLCSAGIMAQLIWGMGANPYHTLYFYVLILLMIVGLVRAVTEGGVLSVKIHVSPFHTLRAFFGLHLPMSSVSLFVPLIVYCNTLFLDLKSFMAPLMANSLKLREDYRMRRGGYHLAVALAILASVLAATATSLILSYDRGADGMHRWFYTGLPRNALFERIATMSRDAPGVSVESRVWLGVGAGVTAALLFLRQHLFWMPHPLGLIMLISPLMNFYWFSILLGWLFNSAVTKYASKEVYHRARGLFIGLIVGELLIAFCALFVTLATGVNPGRQFTLDLF